VLVLSAYTHVCTIRKYSLCLRGTPFMLRHPAERGSVCVNSLRCGSGVNNVSRYCFFVEKKVSDSHYLIINFYKRRWGVRLKTQLSWFCILLLIVTTCFGLARPSSGHNVVHKGENIHNCLYTGVT
jgi:hypothetical protein